MFLNSYNIKIKLIFLFILILFIIIIFKVFYIQVFEYKKLNNLADNLWSRKLPIEANRGRILDRNGVVLADNLTTTSLVLVPSQIKDKDNTSLKLSEILNVSKEEMAKHVNKDTSIERVHPIGRRLDKDTSDKINNLNLEGVYLVKEAKRNYPYNDFLSHVLGYVGIDNQGLSGIELEFDKYLKGTNGSIKYYSDAKGNKLNLDTKYIEPVSGMDISLTIDYNIQKSLERELDNVVKMFNPDNCLALVVDPNNGEVLAMSSRPSFDPNNYKDYSEEVLSRNLPIWASFEPGSTFKISTFASALEENLIDMDKDHFYDPGFTMIGKTRINCWKPSGHGDETYLEVLQNSCNPGFVKLGLMLGKERLFNYLDKYGFMEKSGIDLNGESKGIMFPLNKVGDLELVTTAFGQGVSVTPIQQVMATSSIVNGGNLYKPFVVKSINDPITNSIVYENKSILKRKTISNDTSLKMRRALESVVALGGGKKAYIDGYRIGGKTGTAQKQENGKYLVGNYIMSFMAVVPSNNPQAVLYIAIDNPKNTALLSSYTTTPIARRILLDIIDALSIPKQEGQIIKDYTWEDKEYFDVPNVIGMSVKDAKKLLTNFHIEYSGEGDKIINTSPNPYERIELGETIILHLGNT